MDPDVALTTALDSGAHPTDRANAAQDLLLWLYGGGFMPAAWPKSQDALREELQRIRALRPTPPPRPLLDLS